MVKLLHTYYISYHIFQNDCFVGNPELEQKFDELIKMQAALGSESVNQEKDELELKKLQEENKRWESDVKSFKDREALKENVRILEKKKAWITYKEEVRKFKELQELANQLKEKYEKVTARFKPLEKQISEKESVAVKTQNALKLKVYIFVKLLFRSSL